MTIIAAAYASPMSYALAADSHAEVNGIKIPHVKVARFGALLIGGRTQSQKGESPPATCYPDGIP